MRQKLLFLYIAKEMLLYFFVCFLFFFFIFFVNNILLLAEDILSKQAPFKDVGLLMLYSLPAVIANAAPFAALVGTLMGFGISFDECLGYFYSIFDAAGAVGWRLYFDCFFFYQ